MQVAEGGEKQSVINMLHDTEEGCSVRLAQPHHSSNPEASRTYAPQFFLRVDLSMETVVRRRL